MNFGTVCLNGQAEVVAGKHELPDAVEITFASRRELRVSHFLAGQIGIGDEIRFSLPYEGQAPAAPELLIKQGAGASLYQVLIGYATKPKSDKFHHHYVQVEISGGGLGFAGLHLTCAAIRDYFYLSARNHHPENRTLYDVLKVPHSASPGDLRLAYKLRELELLTTNASSADRAALERAFNILSSTELRTCYDALLADPRSPVPFPFSGFGVILVSGVPINDRFLARRIISFIPQRKTRRFQLALGKLTYYPDRAVYRDSRAKLEMTCDPTLMPIGFTPDWNRWKYLLGAKVDIEAQFVKTGKYYRRGSHWKLATWETALPSRIQVSLPKDLEDTLNTAQRTHHRFGQYADWVRKIRERIEQSPIERRELEQLALKEGIPADFDVAQINWKADYDPFYYRHLCQRAKRLYLFRDEYIFLTQNAVVVETPHAGHATYIFSAPNQMESFLHTYMRTSKQAIRDNQENCADRLGYLGRIVHGKDQKTWCHELHNWLGEAVDHHRVFR